MGGHWTSCLLFCILGFNCKYYPPCPLSFAWTPTRAQTRISMSFFGLGGKRLGMLGTDTTHASSASFGHLAPTQDPTDSALYFEDGSAATPALLSKRAVDFAHRSLDTRLSMRERWDAALKARRCGSALPNAWISRPATVTEPMTEEDTTDDHRLTAQYSTMVDQAEKPLSIKEIQEFVRCYNDFPQLQQHVEERLAQFGTRY